MEIQVRVDRLLEPYRFVKKDGSPCARFSFVGVTLDQYPKSVVFDVVGDDNKWNQMGIRVGLTYTVSYDLSSREYGGKWFTSVNVWRVTPQQVVQQPQQQVMYQQPVQYAQPQVVQQPQPQGVQQPSDKTDELPF